MAEQSRDERVAAIASIQDPLRRALFEAVSRSPLPVGRDEAADLTGMPRTTAAFHLERLVAAGLLTVESQRRSGRTGPGSGRPAKLYRRTAQEVSVAIPERHYDLAGDLLASAIEEADRTGEPVSETLARVATERGREIGAGADSFTGMLEAAGYEPVEDAAGRTILANCPFHRLAQSHTTIICRANLCLLRGAAEGADDREHDIHFDPGDGRCCVSLTLSSS